jgi:hypothetical protein
MEETARVHFDITTFVEQGLIQNWIREIVEESQRQTSVIPEVISAGVVARLWSPLDHAGKLAEVERQILENQGPRVAAVEWFRGIAADPETLDQIVSFIDGKAHYLAGHLQPLKQALGEEWKDAQGAALNWLHERDDLESIRFLLDSVRQGDDLLLVHVCLQALDRDALSANSPCHDMWALVEGLDKDARLLDVSWQEPESWWGELAITL